MESKTDKTEPAFMRNLASAVDYFSPAITKVQEYLGVDTPSIMRSIGRLFGEKVAAMHESRSLNEFILQLAQLWQDSKIGRITIEATDPLIFRTDDCTVCGQLPAEEVAFTCAFHEGFFEAAFSSKLGKAVRVEQDRLFRGDAGTWGRRYIVRIPR